jgi:hypothetical protein
MVVKWVGGGCICDGGYADVDSGYSGNSDDNNNNNNNNNNNSIQFFIIYVPSQQPNGQLQTQHSLDVGIYIIEALVERRKVIIIIIIIIIIINSINSVKIFSLRVKK